MGLVGAKIRRLALAGNGSVEHAAQRDAIDIARMHPEADYPASKLVHNDKYPMGVQQHGLAAKEIDAPDPRLSFVCPR
jgi:hypothetical protein